MQHRDGGFCRDVNARQVRMLFKQLARLPICLVVEIVILHRLQQIQTGIEGSQGGFEGGAFLGVFGDRHVKDGDRHRTLTFADESAQQISRYRATSQGVDGHHPQPSAAGSVGRHAHHRNACAGGTPDPAPPFLGLAWKCNDPVHFLSDRGLESLLLAFAQAAGPELNLYVSQQNSGGLLANSCPNLVPKGCRPFQGIDGNAKRLPRRKIARGQVGTVTESPSHLKHSGLRGWTYTWIVVKSTMDRSDGGTQ